MGAHDVNREIKIFEQFGETLLTPTEGDTLRNAYIGAIRIGQGVTLDFKGVRIISSAFFNYAVGRLYAEFSQAEISKLLTVVNLSDIGKFTLLRVVENSRKYYANQLFRESVDRSNHAALEA